MRVAIPLLLPLFAIVFGCASSGTLVKHGDYARFAEGQATKAEVRRAVGAPDLTYHNPVTDSDCEAYEYVTKDFADSTRVDFCYDPQGTLKSKQCVSGGAGCSR